MTAVRGDVTGEDSVAVTGTATGGSSLGVFGTGDAVGVRGDGKTWHGVAGFSESTTGGYGVYGEGLAGGPGVVGKSKSWHAVAGFSESTTGGFGVYGEAVGSGVVGLSKTWNGVYGETAGVANGPAGVWGEHKSAGIGVKAVSKDGVGLAAFSASNEAIHAETRSPAVAAIAGFNLNPSSTGAAIYGKKEGTQGHAGVFVGNVHVTGSLTADGDIVLSNADCAEDFDIADVGAAEPGTVMVVSDEGALQQSDQAYDRRVAGVISGAGGYKPGIVLDKQRSQTSRRPIALLGKVYCKVDASYAPVGVGDLLTTAPTPGHAMKATDPMKAFGAVIGKALGPLRSGRGLVPVLVALQ
jgi:hypothetical protein